MSFTPASVCDILPNHYYLTRSCLSALNESPDAYSQTEGSFYPPQTCELESFFSILFPTPAPISTRTSSVESATSLDSLSTLWSGPSEDLHHSLDTEERDHDAQPAVVMGDAEDKRFNVTRRTRGPNRRRPGTGYSDLMVRSLVSWSCMMEFYMDSCAVAKDKLPTEVQDALNRNYRNCCEVVVKKDTSTIQKHKFSNRHCSNLPQELHALLPSFACPAFVAMHGSCKSAKYVCSPVMT